MYIHKILRQQEIPSPAIPSRQTDLGIQSLEANTTFVIRVWYGKSCKSECVSPFSSFSFIRTRRLLTEMVSQVTVLQTQVSFIQLLSWQQLFLQFLKVILLSCKKQKKNTNWLISCLLGRGSQSEDGQQNSVVETFFCHLLQPYNVSL